LLDRIEIGRVGRQEARLGAGAQPLGELTQVETRSERSGASPLRGYLTPHRVFVRQNALQVANLDV
jgi:hypothetical protein